MPTETITLHMGPQHPSTHGVLRVDLELDGEVVVAADAQLGYLHRGFEKLCEHRTYQQVVTLTDRCDYVNSMGNELGWVLAIEKMYPDLEIPPRAQALRVALAELQRMCSHLIWVGTFGLDMGAITPFLYCFREREDINNLFEELTGARMMFNYLRVGGIRQQATTGPWELPDGWIDKVVALLDRWPAAIDEYEALLTNNEIVRRRLIGVGVLPVEMGIGYGVSGPNIRGSGLAIDLRKDAPYSGYENYEFDVPVGTVGDCYDRYLVRVRELRESAKIVRQALENLPDGPIMAEGVPRTIKPPEGEVFSLVESPRGQLGYYVISDGTDKPYRVKMRSPAFSNVSAMGELLRGARIADAVVISGSLDHVMGEMDR